MISPEEKVARNSIIIAEASLEQGKENWRNGMWNATLN